MNTNIVPTPATRPTVSRTSHSSDHQPVDRPPISNRRLFATIAGASTLTSLGLAAGVGSLFLIPGDDVGWLTLGALVSLVVAVVTYLATAVVMTRRFRPAGERRGHIAGHIGVIALAGYVLPMLAWLV